MGTEGYTIHVEEFASPALSRLQHDAAALCAALVEETQRQCAQHSEPPPTAVLLFKDAAVKIFRVRQVPLGLVASVSQRLARDWDAKAAAFITLGGVAESAEEADSDKAMPAIVVYTETVDGQHAIDFHRPVATQGKISRFVAMHRATGADAKLSQLFAFFQKET